MRVCTEDLEQVVARPQQDRGTQEKARRDGAKAREEGQSSKGTSGIAAPHSEVQRDTPRATGHLMNDAPEPRRSALFIIKRGSGDVAGKLFSREGIGTFNYMKAFIYHRTPKGRIR